MGIVTFLFALISGFVLKDAQKQDEETLRSRMRQTEQLELQERSSDALKDMGARLDKCTALLESAKAKGSSGSVAHLNSSENTQQREIDSLRTSMQAIKDELANFQIALGDDPGKRLAAVVLRKDLDDLIESDKAQSLNLKEQIAEAHEDAKSNMEVFKWLLGAVGVSNLIAPLAGALLGRKPEPAKES